VARQANVSQQPGLTAAYRLIDRESGKGLTVTIRDPRMPWRRASSSASKVSQAARTQRAHGSTERVEVGRSPLTVRAVVDSLDRQLRQLVDTGEPTESRGRIFMPTASELRFGGASKPKGRTGKKPCRDATAFRLPRVPIRPGTRDIEVEKSRVIHRGGTR
jgi:hypothetical protein